MLEPFVERAPSRYRYMAGVLDSLRALGGEAAVGRVYEWLVEQKIAYPDDLTTLQSDGGSRFHKEVRWARKELFDAGLLMAPDRGTWALTDTGFVTELTPQAARQMVSARASERRRMKAEADSGVSHELADQTPAQKRRTDREAGPTYEAEQKMLIQLQSYRTVGERLRCSEEILKSFWAKL